MSRPLYIATDRRNAFSWISRGLILPTSFMDKYKDDAMSSASGVLLVGDAEAAARLAGASALPVVVELDTNGLELDIEPTTGSAVPIRGAISARRIVRLHLPDEAEREEVAARAYRGFDGATLPLAVTPALFGGGPEHTSPPADTAQELPSDDHDLRRREALVAVAATIPSDQLAHRVGELLLTGAGDWTELVTELQRSGTVTSEADAGLLRHVGEVLMGLPRGAEPAADDVVEAVRARLPENLLQQVETHLQWIVQLSRGEAALQPFKDRGGIRSAKALLLYLLRPTPEGVRGWDAAEQNAGPEVVDLAAMLAGLVSGYGGLPAELRAAPGLDALLDWAAVGLKPTDVRPNPRPAATDEPGGVMSGNGMTAQDSSSDAPEGSSAPSGAARQLPVEELRRQLEASVAEGDQAVALAVAERLGWRDAQRVVVVAPAFEVTARGRNVEVSFPPGTVPQSRLVTHRFLELLRGLPDHQLATQVEAVQPESSRPKPTRKRASRATGPRSRSSVSQSAEAVTATAAEASAPQGPLGERSHIEAGVGPAPSDAQAPDALPLDAISGDT